MCMCSVETDTVNPGVMHFNAFLNEIKTRNILRRFVLARWRLQKGSSWGEPARKGKRNEGRNRCKCCKAGVFPCVAADPRVQQIGRVFKSFLLSFHHAAPLAK